MVKQVYQAYQDMIASGKIQYDSSQQKLIMTLDELLSKVNNYLPTSKNYLFSLWKKPLTPKGLYIYGEVGRGKTMLMDIFFSLVSSKKKMRVHFNDFMTDIHNRITLHRKDFADKKNKQNDPIIPVAQQIASEVKLLCFDEFTVTDIADAMILSRLFENLFKLGVILVATSNVAPKDLYKNGLNRELFLPFIDKLEQNVKSFNVQVEQDYRLTKTNEAKYYFYPLTEANINEFEQKWIDLTLGSSVVANQTISFRGRKINVPMSTSGFAKFDYMDLCGKPFAAADYLEILKKYHTIFLANVPIMTNNNSNQAKRFILLIDSLYDKNIRLFMSSESDIGSLYITETGNELEAFEFSRTYSRLFEMQSEEYLLNWEKSTLLS
ncbi:cell division protein ZapE [Bartonella sp. DGB1]|uniref:cell division protein ZapE n=1 Tax=Bartonella sp. DGB1 TaxID=3239807 RepID=UPI0035254BFD